MKDQHEKIKGYRELSQTEIDLMNEGKELAETVKEYLEKVEVTINAIDPRWMSIGRTHLQQGFMAAIRAIARPSTF